MTARIGLTPEQSANSFTDEELEGMSYGNNPQSIAYRELLAFRRSAVQVAVAGKAPDHVGGANNMAVPERWPPDDGDFVSVPRGLLAAASSAIDKKRDAPRILSWLRHYSLLAAAPKQEDWRNCGVCGGRFLPDDDANRMTCCLCAAPKLEAPHR
jgi:hypothetical protein